MFIAGTKVHSQYESILENLYCTRMHFQIMDETRTCTRVDSEIMDETRTCTRVEFKIMNESRRFYEDSCETRTRISRRLYESSRALDIDEHV